MGRSKRTLKTMVRRLEELARKPKIASKLEVAGLVREIRGKMGIRTVEELGLLLGVSGASVSRWQRGQSVPRLQTVLKFREQILSGAEGPTKPITVVLISPVPIKVIVRRQR